MVETLQSGGCALALAVGIRVVDKTALKDGADDVDERVMDDPVTEMRGAYLPRLGVADCEGGEGLWLVGFGEQLPLELVEVVLEVLLELDDIWLIGFALFGFLESQEKVVVAAKRLEEMAIGFHGNGSAPKS